MKTIQGAGRKMEAARWILVLAFSFWLLPFGFASEIDSIIKAAPGHDAYPEAGALILLDRRIETVV